jgi:2-polyprenyl-3-methyl-5-hydroxy-6-metoxy-1,4-benzoquinol methylase
VFGGGGKRACEGNVLASYPRKMRNNVEEKTINFQPVARLQEVVDALLSNRGNIKVLEAGCGSYSYVSTPKNASSYIVGIDISEEQLRKNTVVNEKIVGDIEVYQFSPSQFDLIICWWVLEHLSHPERALNNFLKTLKDGGIIVLAVPNVLSIKGIVTKYTPFWFHKWVYRSFFGVTDFDQFRTFLRFSISPLSIERFAARNGLSIAYSSLFTYPKTRKIIEKYEVIKVGWWLVRQICNVLSFGKTDVGLTEYLVVLKKQGTALQLFPRYDTSAKNADSSIEG